MRAGDYASSYIDPLEMTLAILAEYEEVHKRPRVYRLSR